MKALMDMTTPIGIWLANELDHVSLVMSDHLKNEHKEVTAICGELAAYRGKMLRPTVLLLSWRSVSSCETTPHEVRVAAGVVELIHLATLVHDDILDEADLRRGAQTINSLLGNEAAVMLGDYLLSSAFLLCSTVKNPELNLLLGEVTNTLCAGELVQLSRRNDVDLDLESYFQIIHDKTASLIAASCEMGAMLGKGSGCEIKALKEFGSSVGMAFQIKDDILDLLGEREIIGKPAGRDLDKGKLTLPIITMLVDNPSLKEEVQKIMGNADRDALSALLHSTGAISSAFDMVSKMVNAAICGVEEVIENESSKQLCALAKQLKSSV
ncbi:MAG TPA: polyprenyl synthetase family protein [Phycisphaerales bacterium]|nr:polyprenyl synthetase family protein [Phycisphaerales bacterium]HIB50214.1 polyprenyl synthetase family protein [Phycisphaerales bacterium]HIO53437.1 polyprenyl synthetase family protein [Phycisphaerales bacterium]